jgi:hypothetical protein
VPENDARFAHHSEMAFLTTAKVELGLSSLHVKAIPRLKRICWLHVFEDAADLACRFERDRFEVVELRVVPVHLR